MIRLAQPPIDEGDIAAAAEVLRSGWLIQGAAVRAFEEETARIAGCRHGVAVTNGTAALHLGLLALGLRPGEEVAVACYSWPATANAVVLAGATPVFVDIEARRFGMDPERLREVLRAHPRIRAILPVHAFGGFCAIAEIRRQAEERGIPILEDSACALGARLDGRPAGAWGAAACFSFHARKVVTTGEGGMVVTDDPEIADRVRALRNHGLDPAAGSPEFRQAGFNCRLTEFQGAIGRRQVQRLPALIAAHRRLARAYDERLAPLPVTRPTAPGEDAHIYQAYVVLLPPALAGERAGLIARMKEAGVETTIGTYHIPLVRYFREVGGYAAGDFPVADDVAARALALPIHHAMTETDVGLVADALASALDRAAA